MTMAKHGGAGIMPRPGEWSLAGFPADDDDADEPVTWPGTAPERDAPFQKPGGDMPAPPPPAEIEPGPASP